MQRLPIDHQPSLRERRRQVLRDLAQALAKAHRRAADKLPRGLRLHVSSTLPAAPGGVRKTQSRGPLSVSQPTDEVVLSSIRIVTDSSRLSGGGAASVPAAAPLQHRRQTGRAALHHRRVDMTQVPDDYRELMDATWGKSAAVDASVQQVSLSDATDSAAGATEFGSAPFQPLQQLQWPPSLLSADVAVAGAYLAGVTPAQLWQTPSMTPSAPLATGVMAEGGMAMTVDYAAAAAGGHTSGLMDLLCDGQDGASGGPEAGTGGPLAEELEWE